MPQPRKNLAFALLSCAAAGAIAFAFVDSGQSSAFPFTSVTPQELARGGVTLSTVSPPTDLPISAADATAAARKFAGGRRALEVRYVRCVDATKEPKLDEGCWAVSIDPHGMTAPGGPVLMPSGTSKPRPRPVVHYDLVFVDANSGKVIEGTLGS